MKTLLKNKYVKAGIATILSILGLIAMFYFILLLTILPQIMNKETLSIIAIIMLTIIGMLWLYLAWYSYYDNR